MQQACIRCAVSKSAPKVESTAIVHLGRYGDIMLMLPIAKDIADTTGKPVPWVVSRKYADIFDGVSYVKPDLYPGTFTELYVAYRYAKSKYSNLIAPRQVWEHPDKRDTSYDRSTWKSIGYLDKWGKLPLVFDRRSSEREQELVAKWRKPGVRNLMLNMEGSSSPFGRYKYEVYDVLSSLQGWNVIDLSVFKCKRLFDLLGLMDACDLLITIDTSTLHLAKASNIPTIAFISGDRHFWGSSTPQCNCVYQCYYGDVPKSLDGIRNAINEIHPKSGPH